MTILESTHTKKVNQVAKADKIKAIKIVGAVLNLNNDGRTYYVGTDDENYFLFVGKQCDNPNNYLTAYDEMWDDL